MNKSDIACRIKNAIEEKLCSLGAYVDKELPEYILVMIANKKNKDSMAKDLQLFLGTETSVFIEWLHELLEKCQTNPEEAFRIKTEKPSKNKSSDVSDKKKKIDKEKQKVKSKSKKNDEKKEHKKSNLNKTSKVRSRSRSPVSELPRNADSKKPKLKVTPDKMESKVIIKHSEIDLTKEDTTTTTTSTNTSTSNHEVVEQKTISIIASTVKVTERQPMKKEIAKSSFEKIQRDLKQAEADITNKIESIVEKPSQRKSVFNRLGTNDLRSTKLSRKTDEVTESRERSPLKRTIHSVIKHDAIEHDAIDIRESKIKRMEIKSHSPSPNFIVTLNGLEKLNNVPLTSRLGPKRSQEKMESFDEEEEEDETEEMTINDPITDDSSLQETKENNTEIIVDNQTKCKFWPACKNKETCPFVHPTEPCQAFPSCKFGALCLFIHPNCRFSSNCTKHDCPFTHYGPRMMSSTVKQIPHNSISRCLFYPNCTNVNCKFFHPNLPCKFGLGCMLKETCNFYHPTIPKSSDLKWKASQQESVNTPSVIDTSSKKTEIQTV